MDPDLLEIPWTACRVPTYLESRHTDYDERALFALFGLVPIPLCRPDRHTIVVQRSGSIEPFRSFALTGQRPVAKHAAPQMLQVYPMETGVSAVMLRIYAILGLATATADTPSCVIRRDRLGREVSAIPGILAELRQFREKFKECTVQMPFFDIYRELIDDSYPDALARLGVDNLLARRAVALPGANVKFPRLLADAEVDAATQLLASWFGMKYVKEGSDEKKTARWRLCPHGG